MGLKVGLIIGAVLLITVAGTLWIMNIFGIELQRVSLGALIIALGMLVDNAIVVVENIHRHFKLKWGEAHQVTTYALDEVGNPTILATFAIISALMPPPV